MARFMQNSPFAHYWDHSDLMMVSKFPAFLLVTAMTGLCAPAARADVYKFVSRNGQVIYTDSPRHRGYKLVIKTPEPAVKPVTISLGMGRKLGNDRPAPTGVAALMPKTDKGRMMSMRRAQYADVIEQAAYKHGLDPALLHAVIRAESSYNPGAVSHKGAMGLMQLMPGTAARYGVRNPYDPEENIFGGARYLRDLMGMFRSDIRLAVAAYNAGEHNVMKYGYQVPPFPETQDYVSKVLGFYSRLN